MKVTTTPHQFITDNFVNEVKKSLLSKIRFYDLPVSDAESLENQQLAAIIEEHEYEQVELSLRTAMYIDRSVLLAQDALERLSERVKLSDGYKEQLTSIVDEAIKYNIPISIDDDYFDIKDKVAICKTATKYGISFDPANIDWLELEDVISSWERLLDEAERANIYWKEDNHDPIALQQFIEDREREERNYYRQTRWDYYNSVA